MGYNTENALASAPGIIFGCLDSGGMLLDRNSGEYLPADQVIRDPLHIQQLDFFDEDHRGCLKPGLRTRSLDDDTEPMDDDDE